MRYFFHIGYKGTAYRGWQKQVNAKSIQATLEDVLSKFLKQEIHCIGCGRTDAGVHASQYFFHVDINFEIDQALFFPINRMLPSDITIYDIYKVEDHFHAQFDATQRTYNYFIHTDKNPFLNDISSLYLIESNLEIMQEAANLLLGKKDFRAFCKTPDRHNHTICNLKTAQLYTDVSGKFIRFEVTADRFLKGMIRIIMHQLIEVGTGKLSITEFHNQLVNQKTPKFLKLAYPQGLYLSEIKYPFLNIEPASDFCPLLKTQDWLTVHYKQDII